MSNFVTTLVILLAADSLFVLVAAFMQKWKLVGVGFAIGAVLDLLIFKYGG